MEVRHGHIVAGIDLSEMQYMEVKCSKISDF